MSLLGSVVRKIYALLRYVTYKSNLTQMVNEKSSHARYYYKRNYWYFYLLIVTWESL
jgi:uncharacterized protein YhbP (UPF0306 family)